jgi:hypothetical protein
MTCSIVGQISKITKTDRLLMCWWAFTGLTHIILEGYFAFSPEFYKVNKPHYLAEVCKFVALFYSLCASSSADFKAEILYGLEICMIPIWSFGFCLVLSSMILHMYRLSMVQVY